MSIRIVDPETGAVTIGRTIDRGAELARSYLDSPYFHADLSTPGRWKPVK
jgi:hypothetical protein